MKKTIFLGLAMLFATLSFAQNNRSTAEVFLQITKPGKYTVYLDDEVVGSATGRFRFYDIHNSKPELSIMQGDRLILREQINVNAQERLILGYDNGRLNVIKQLSLFRNNQYALDDFYDYMGDLNTGPVQPTLADLNYRLLSLEAFQEFYTSYKKSSFDNERVELINAVNKKASFSSSQCKLMLKAFTFDTERLKTAKSLYQTVVDPQNYFTIAETFEFFNYKDDFLKYLEKQ